MTVSSDPATGAPRRTAEEVYADYHGTRARREALRLQHVALCRHLEREHAQAQALQEAMDKCDLALHHMEREASALVLWP